MARITVRHDWRLTADPEQAAARERRRALERSDILYFPRTPLHFEEDDLQFLRTPKQSGAGDRKNIACRPGQGRITAYAGGQEERMRTVLEGQFALEHTMLVKRQSLLMPEIAPSKRIENLIQRSIA